jgi:hypothetical protein
LQAVATHEIGHALSLDHSGAASPGANNVRATDGSFVDRATMFFNGPIPAKFTLDDREGVLYNYGAWKQLPGIAVDVAAGGDSPVSPAVWVTSSGNSIWKLNGSNNPTQDTATPPRGGVSIAVTGNGVPWVVSSGNQIFRKNSTSPTSGSWGSSLGNARDIGIGGGLNDSIWIISNTVSGSAGNFDVQRWNGTATGAGNFVGTPAGGFGVRITVDSRGFPWVVQADGSIWANPSRDGSQFWGQVTAGSSCARDIGAGQFTAHPSTGWITDGRVPPQLSPLGGMYVLGCQNFGSDNDIWVFNYQMTSTVSGDSAPTVLAWRQLEGSGHRIAVGPDARAVVIQSNGAIYIRNPR